MSVAVAWPANLERISMLSRARTFEVWDCWDEDRCCRVVVKLPREERIGDERAERQLLAEGRLLEDIAHPHILRAYATIAEPVPMIVTEVLGGETLARMIDEAGHLESEEIAHLGLQLCSALACLHSRGIAHLDLKPSNVIGEAGRARLIDLGLASAFGDGRPERGTWSYMAPEQVTGVGLGPSTDVWGLAATLFECLAGHPPFDDPDIEGLDPDFEPEGSDDTDETDDRPRRYPQLRRNVSLPADDAAGDPRLRLLILAGLRPDPDTRPTLRQMAAGLESVLGLPEERRRHSRSIP